jgi:hypothetical protein
LKGGSHEFSESGKPFHLMRYLRRQSSRFESRISSIFEIFLVFFDVKRKKCRRKTRFERRGSDKVEEGNIEDVMELAHRGRKDGLVSL